jgi:hypothetical protein
LYQLSSIPVEFQWERHDKYVMDWRVVWVALEIWGKVKGLLGEAGKREAGREAGVGQYQAEEGDEFEEVREDRDQEVEGVEGEQEVAWVFLPYRSGIRKPKPHQKNKSELYHSNFLDGCI